jgi:hypothetical protein
VSKPQAQVRLGPERQARFDAKLAQVGITASDALKEAVDLWLSGRVSAPVATPRRPQQPRGNPAREDDMEARRQSVATSVPLMDRKTFNPQPKAGKRK